MIEARGRTWAAGLLALGLLALALVGPLTRFIDTSATWLDYPYPRPGSEGLILYESLLLKNGGDIYDPITPSRFISGPYPPLYYWLAAQVLPNQLLDFTNPGSVDSIFRSGRSIALISTLIAAALITLLVIFEGGYAQRGPRYVLLASIGGAFGGALLLTLPQVLVWATRFRGDMLMIALTAAGLTCVAAGAPPNAKTQNRILLYLAATFFALAFFTKQTALAGPMASAFYLLLRDWKSGLRWCLVMLAAVAIPFVIIDVATGHWFYLKMVVYHSLPLSLRTFTRLLGFAFWDEQWPLIIIAAGYAIYRLANAFLSGLIRNAPLLIPLFVLASFLTLPTGGVLGADHNHLLIPGLAITSAIGALLAWSLTSLQQPRYSATQSKIGVPSGSLKSKMATSLVTFALLIIYALFTSEPSAVGYGPDLAMRSPAENEQVRKIVQYVHDSPGTVFSDDPGILALAGKETSYDDPFTMTALANQGKWDETVYRNMLREAKFSRLVLSCDVIGTLAQGDAAKNGTTLEVARPCRSDTYTQGVLEAIRDGYKVIFRDVYFTYAPKTEGQSLLSTSIMDPKGQ